MNVLRNHVAALRRRWGVVAGLTVAAVLAAFGLTQLMPVTYTSSAQVYVSIVGASSVTDLAQGGAFAQRYMQTFAKLAHTETVLAPVIERLDLATDVNGLSDQVKVDVPPDTVMMDISASDTDPAQATLIADAVADQLTEAIPDLQDGGVRASVVQTADTPASPSSPNPPANILIGLILGLFLGVGAAILLDVLDTRVTSVEDMEGIVDAPIVGAIPYDAGAATLPLVLRDLDGVNSARSEAFRAVRTNLGFLEIAGREVRVLTVTSSLPGEGKSSVAGNIVLALAAAGHSVCLVECDLRRPKLMEYFGMPQGTGLTDVLANRVDVESALVDLDTNVVALGAGTVPPNPSELLGSPRMARVVEHLRSRFDYVLIDAPPVVPVTDAVVVSAHSDGILMVVGSGVVHTDDLKAGLRTLSASSVPLLGVIANRVPRPAGRSKSGYSSYYGSAGGGRAPKPTPTRHSSRRRRRAADTRAAVDYA